MELENVKILLAEKEEEIERLKSEVENHYKDA
jgi:hypothetical protein